MAIGWSGRGASAWMAAGVTAIGVFAGAAWADSKAVPGARAGVGVAHALFARELMGLGEDTTPGDLRLTEAQVASLRKIVGERREALKAARQEHTEDRDAREKAKQAVESAQQSKGERVGALRAQIEALQAKRTALRAQIDALPGGSPDRKGKRAEIDAIKAQIEALQAQLEGVRAESTETIKDAQDAKRQKGDELRERTTQVPSVAQTQAAMRAVLTPAQQTALDERLAKAAQALARLGVEPGEGTGD